MIGSVAVGVGILLVSETLVSTESFKKNTENLAASVVASSGITNDRASLITVKVYYSMMAQYIDVTEEKFVLQPPATIQNLIDTCTLRHPSIARMMGTMMILLDGVPSKPSAPLQDGDTIQFIPLSAGG
jgi:molybdopterin converting factor small subunit